MPLYSYDLETYHSYFLAVFEDLDSGEMFSFEHKDIPELLQWMQSGARRFVGYNSHGFDDIIMRYIRRKTAPASAFFKTGSGVTTQDINNLSTLIITTDRKDPVALAKLESAIHGIKWAQQHETLTSIDVKSLLDPMPSLKKVECRLKFNNVEDLPFDPSLPTSDEQNKIIHEYCKNDVRILTKLYLTEALPHLKLRKYLEKTFGVLGLESMSEPRTAERILMNLYMQRTGEKWAVIKEGAQENFENHCMYGIPVMKFVPDWIEFETPELQELLDKFKKMELPVKPATGHVDGAQIKQQIIIGDLAYQLGIGGIHSTEKKVVIKPSDKQLIMTDITSMYPQTMIRDSLHPTHVSKVWIDIYTQIRDLRLVAKRKGDAVAAHALKIIINSVFGKTSSRYSPFYDPTLTIKITVTGQLALLMLIEQFHINGILVISANTDGVLVHITKEQTAVFEECKTKWSALTKYDLEDEAFQSIFIRDINSYLAVTLDGEVKQKGRFAKANLKKDVQAYAVTDMAINYLVHGTPLDEYFRTTSYSIYDFLYSFSATSAFTVSLDSVDLKTQLTKTNRWYVSKTEINQLTKFGGKNQNLNRIPNGTNIRIANKVTTEELPDDLDMEYYYRQANKLINSITGEMI